MIAREATGAGDCDQSERHGIAGIGSVVLVKSTDSERGGFRAHEIVRLTLRPSIHCGIDKRPALGLVLPVTLRSKPSK